MNSRLVDGNVVQDSTENDTGKKGDDNENGPTELGETSASASATRKRSHSYENNMLHNSIASSPYYGHGNSPTHIHSNTENPRTLKRVRASPFQIMNPSDESRISVNRESKLIGSQNSPGNASLTSSYSHQKIPDVYSRQMEQKNFEENIVESMNNRSNAYLLSPQTLQTQFAPQQLRAQTSLLENVYNSGNNLRSSDGVGIHDILDHSRSESNSIPMSQRGQSIISHNTSLLENEKRRHYKALQDRVNASRTRFDDLQAGLRMSANMFGSRAEPDDDRRGNQEVDEYLLANSTPRHGNHILPSNENHHALSSAGSASFASNQLISTGIQERSIGNHDRLFIHQMQGSKHSSFSVKHLKNDAASGKSCESHPSDPHPFPQARHGSQLTSYDIGMLRHQKEGIDTDQKERQAGSLHELPCHFRGRVFVPLGTIEDEIWLSPFLCFLRSQCIEMFKAKDVDVSYRRSAKTKIEIHQIGIRCRFCAHKPYQNRGKRSSSFPSSVSRIYQSVTMMIREHFHSCTEFPEEVRKRYCALKGETTKGELESKRYWAQSATKLGMTDTAHGIFFTSQTQTARLP